jgi:hypothetical protein
MPRSHSVRNIKSAINPGNMNTLFNKPTSDETYSRYKKPSNPKLFQSFTFSDAPQPEEKAKRQVK